MSKHCLIEACCCPPPEFDGQIVKPPFIKRHATGSMMVSEKFCYSSEHSVELIAKVSMLLSAGM